MLATGGNQKDLFPFLVGQVGAAMSAPGIIPRADFNGRPLLSGPSIQNQISLPRNSHVAGYGNDFAMAVAVEVFHPFDMVHDITYGRAFPQLLAFRVVGRQPRSGRDDNVDRKSTR